MADEARESALVRKRPYSLRNAANNTSDCSSSSNTKRKYSKYFPAKDKKDGLLQETERKRTNDKFEDFDVHDGATKNSSEELVCLTSKLLSRSFYDTPTIDLARNLLGKHTVRVLETGEVLVGRIVETESYLGSEDKACHSYGGKRTKRNEAMFMAPGTAYVYFIYGMYYCLNICSQEAGACVLIRALEPVKGLETLKTFRGIKHKDKGAALKEGQLCNGPSKLCQALNINKSNLNMEDMTISSQFWLEDAPSTNDFQIVTSHRIGIDSYGTEAALQPLRFYILGSKSVSVRDKKAENTLHVV